MRVAGVVSALCMSTGVGQAGGYAVWASKSVLKLGALLFAQRHTLPEFRCPEAIIPCQRREQPELVPQPENEVKAVLIFLSGAVLGVTLGISAAAWWFRKLEQQAHQQHGVDRPVAPHRRLQAIRAGAAKSSDSSSSGTDRARPRAHALSR